MNILTELITQMIAEQRDKKLKASDDEEKRAAFEPAAFIDDAAQKATRLKAVTHAAKFTHGDSKSSSVLDAQTLPAPMPVVSTLSVQRPSLDIVGWAAVFHIAKLLLLNAGDGSLLEQLRDGDYSALEPLATSPEQLQGWVDAFCAVTTADEPHAHKYGKELYFPVGDGYHMLSPLFPTSLYHEIHQRMSDVRFSDDAKAAAAARKAGEYHAGRVVFFPGIAAMNFGGSKPQNASYLNSKRGGTIRLLPCTPPTWQGRTEQVDSPRQVFERSSFGYTARDAVRGLRDFLIGTGTYSNADIKRGRDRRLGLIIDELIQFIAPHADCWPEGWHTEMATRFGSWLARELRGKKNELNTQRIEAEFFAAAALRELKGVFA